MFSSRWVSVRYRVILRHACAAPHTVGDPTTVPQGGQPHMKRYHPLTQLLAVAGAFVVVTTFAFSSSVATSIDFAVAIGATLAGLAIATIAPRPRRAHVGIGVGT